MAELQHIEVRAHSSAGGEIVKPLCELGDYVGDACRALRGHPRCWPAPTCLRCAAYIDREDLP